MQNRNSEIIHKRIERQDLSCYGMILVTGLEFPMYGLNYDAGLLISTKRKFLLKRFRKLIFISHPAE